MIEAKKHRHITKFFTAKVRARSTVNSDDLSLRMASGPANLSDKLNVMGFKAGDDVVVLLASDFEELTGLVVTKTEEEKRQVRRAAKDAALGVPRNRFKTPINRETK